MPNIVLCRIDERLIHGQVGVQWVGFAGANLVLVANDEVADDPVQQNLMEMVLAEGIAVRFWSLQKVIDPSPVLTSEICITPVANSKLPKRYL